MTKVIRFVFVSISECKQKGKALSGTTSGSIVATLSPLEYKAKRMTVWSSVFCLSRIV